MQDSRRSWHGTVSRPATGANVRRERVYARHRYEGMRESRLTRWYICAGAAVLLALAWLILASGTFSVASASFSGYSRVSPTQLEEAVRGQLSGRKLAVVPRANYFLLNVAGIEGSLRAVPGISSATVTKRFPNTIEVTVVEQTANLVWITAGQPYELDLDGKVLRRLEPDALPDLPTILDASNAGVTVGQVVMSTQAASTTVAASQGLAGTKVARFSVASQDPVDLNAEIEGGWTVRLSVLKDLNQQREALRAVLGGLSAADAQRLEYVDVRTPDLPTYKLR